LRIREEGEMLHEILQAQFRRGKWANVKSFHRQSMCELAEETVSRVIGRNFEPGIPTFIVIAYHLGMKPQEIAAACKKAGDKVYWRLMAPDEKDTGERELLDGFSRLDEAKKSLVLDLIHKLG
jgi:hypothetical protein